MEQSVRKNRTKLADAHDKLVQLYRTTKRADLKEDIAECIALMQTAIRLESELRDKFRHAVSRGQGAGISPEQ